MVDFAKLADESAHRAAIGGTKGGSLIGLREHPPRALVEAVTKLDRFQRAAVEAILDPAGGNIRLISVAGAGKTTTVIATIGCLIHNGVDSSSIIATSFTKKAGHELKTRLVPLIGSYNAGLVDPRTFHSLALQRLRKLHPARWAMTQCLNLAKGWGQQGTLPSVGYIWKTIVGWDRNGVPGTKADSLDCYGLPEAYEAEINLLRCEGLSAFTEEGQKAAKRSELPALGKAWALYEEAKQALHAWDFNDALEAYWKGLQDGSIQDKAAFALIDEAQDCNRVQLDIAKLLAREGRLVLCGDQVQSVYQFQGSNPSTLVNAEKEINAKTYTLAYNYRSAGPIVELGNRIAKAQPKAWLAGRDDALVGRTDLTGTITVLEAEDPLDEAFKTADHIATEVKEGRARYSDFMVLTRTNAAGALYEGAFMSHQIPYESKGRTPFFERRDVLAYVAYAILASADSWHALDRIVNIPKRYLTGAFSKAVGTKMNEGHDLLSALTGAVMSEKGRKRETAQELLQLVRQLRKMPWNQATHLIAKTLKESLPKKEGKAADRSDDRSAVPDICAGLARRFDSGLDFARYAAACAENPKVKKDERDEKSAGDCVVVATVHAVKGGEAPIVFVSIPDGIFPHSNAEKKTEVEEELRLAYVAVTRAQKHLILSYPKNNMDMEPVGPSCLLNYMQPQED